MEKCNFCDREFERHVARVYHENRCNNNPDRKIQWNKGLNKKNDERIKKYSESQTRTRKSEEWKNNHPVWNKGLNKNSDERVRKNSESMTKRKNDLEWKEDHKKRIFEKYNGKHFTQTEEYKENMRKACYKKYGFNSPMQHPDVFEKSKRNSFKRHLYLTPDNNELLLQGYEPFAIDKLLFEFNISEYDIKTKASEIPEIFLDESHRYYPDLYVKSLNKIIEVKSEYTVACNKELNIKKHLRTKELGYNHEIWICYPKENKIEIITDLEKYYREN